MVIPMQVCSDSVQVSVHKWAHELGPKGPKEKQLVGNQLPETEHAAFCIKFINYGPLK